MVKFAKKALIQWVNNNNGFTISGVNPQGISATLFHFNKTLAAYQ